MGTAQIIFIQASIQNLYDSQVVLNHQLLAAKFLDFRVDKICGGSFNQLLQGSIISPNWPGSYPAYSQCTWEITAEQDRRILIVIPEISLGDSGQPGVEFCGDSLTITGNTQKLFDIISFAIYFRLCLIPLMKSHPIHHHLEYCQRQVDNMVELPG